MFVRDAESDGADPERADPETGPSATSGSPAPNVPATNVVVTGAAGWLGQNLVRTLADQPARRRIRCLVSQRGDASMLEVIDPRIEVIAGDVRDPTVVDELFDGIGHASVLHAAGVIHPARRVRELFDVNVGGTQLVLDRARRVGAARFVHVSSNSPFGANRSSDDRFDEDSPFAPYMAYGRSKLEAEQLVQRSYDRGDLATVIVRPPWFYGPFQPERQTQFLVGGPARPLPARRAGYATPFDGLHGEPRAGRAARGGRRRRARPRVLDRRRRALRAARRVANGAAARSRPKGSACRTGARCPVPRIAGVVAEKLDALAQAGGRYVQVLHVLGELKDTIACDISRARKELGYEPTVALYDGMRASVRWCLERGDPL